MPGTPSGDVITTPNAREIIAYNALLANGTVPTSYPAAVDLTINGAITASGTAQTITIDSATLPIAMQPGQFLLFRDSAGSYLAAVTALQAAGATTTFTAIARENIPDTAVATFPARFYLATQMDTSETTGTTTFQTFDHGGTSETARGESSQSISSGAGDSYYNAGLRTLVYAQRNGIDVMFAMEQPNPDSNVFTTSPPIEWVVGKVTDVSAAGGVNDKRTRTVNVAVDGGIREVAPS
ncbi:MAG: hypothetical protein AAGD09_03585 [Cyanobacteria bacterium P01_F01_bin.56]